MKPCGALNERDRQCSVQRTARYSPQVSGTHPNHCLYDDGGWGGRGLRGGRAGRGGRSARVCWGHQKRWCSQPGDAASSQEPMPHLGMPPRTLR